MKKILNSIFIFACIVFAWLIFENKIIGLFDKYILPVLSNITLNEFSNCVFFVIIAFVIYKIYQCIINRYYIPYLVFAISLFGIYIYIKYRTIGKYLSLPPIIWNFGYSDILTTLLAIFLAISFVFYFSRKHKNNSHQSRLIPDTPIEEAKFDLLDYSECAQSLAGDIEGIQLSSSFSIGLTAPWGMGKTSFLNILEKNLKKDRFIIIKYNPRHSYNCKNIQEDFFNELFSELQKYDFRFSSTFKDYLKAIDVVNENKFLTFIFNIHKTWDKDSEKEKINDAILRLRKRIIVIIEDFDRLLADEIIEVFKLIDGNASFTNMIFITAYDKKHINRIIGEAYSNEETYFSDKFFSIEMSIPLRPYDKIYKYLEERLLERIEIDNEKQAQYKATLSHHLELLKKYILTLRDAKRFINLFIIQYKQVKEEVEFKDYFLLYLIKFKHIDEYLRLYKKEFVSTNIMKASNRYFLEETLPKLNSKDILEVLFSETSEYTQRSINNEVAFDIYFHETVYGHLSLKEMEVMLFSDFFSIKSVIDKSVKEKTIQDIISFLDAKNILTLGSRHQFEKYLDILIYINNHNIETTITYFKILVLIYAQISKEIIATYHFTSEEYKKLISMKLQGYYPEYPSNFIRSILIGVINQEFHEEILFTKEDLLNIANNTLDDLIANDRVVKQLHIDLLYCCIYNIDPNTRIVSLDISACAKIKALIENQPKGYFTNFVRLGMISLNQNYNSIACEPFWRQIFGDSSNFKKFIEQQNKESLPNIELITNFWRLYENNNYKPIEFHNQGNVQEKINNNLKEEVRKLDEILNIEQKFMNFEQDRASEPQKNSTDFYLQQYKKLMNQIDTIKLYLTKVGQIRSDIEAIINSMS